MYCTTFRVSIFVIKDETWTKQQRGALSFQIPKAIKKSFIPKDTGNSLNIHMQSFEIHESNTIEFFASVCFSSHTEVTVANEFIRIDIFKDSIPNHSVTFTNRASIFSIGN